MDSHEEGKFVEDPDRGDGVVDGLHPVNGDRRQHEAEDKDDSVEDPHESHHQHSGLRRRVHRRISGRSGRWRGQQLVTNHRVFGLFYLTFLHDCHKKDVNERQRNHENICERNS